MCSWPDWHRIIGRVLHDLGKLEQEEKETQKKASKPNYLIVFLFSFFSFLAFMYILASISLWVWVIFFPCLCVT